MNNNSTKQPNKFTRFLRNNIALLLLIFCVLAITAVVLAVTLTRNDTPVIPNDPVGGNPNDDQPGSTPPDDKPTQPTTQKVDVYFNSPVNYSEIGLEYTFGPSNLFTYKSTLNEWSAHKALDLKATEGAEVTAMYDGTVIETGKSFLKGNYVVIDHGEGVIATYASLEDVEVTKGQSVTREQTIGYVSTTAESEYKEGPHLHLEVTVDGVNTDPTPYAEGKIYRTVEVTAE